MIEYSLLYRWSSKELEHFVYFALLLFICMMLAESLMMIVANIVPDFLMGILTGARAQGVMMIFEVFFRLPDHLPKSLRRYDPLHCTPRARRSRVLQKRFLRVSIPNTLGGGPSTIAGEEILKNTWHVEMG